MTDDDATTQEPAPPAARALPSIPLLEVLAHPDLTRIGDWLDVGRTPRLVQRSTPLIPRGGGPARALGDRQVTSHIAEISFRGGRFHWSPVNPEKVQALAAPHFVPVAAGQPLPPGSVLLVGRTLLLGLDHRPLRQRDPAVHRFAGESAAIWAAWDRVARYAPSDLPVLLQAASGSGKERVARALHAQSGRKGPFVPVNGASLNPELADSLLFGHVRGAFTGATDDRPGFFEQADGGTLFLDEVAEIPLGVQARLLRVLQEGRLRRTGAAGEERPVRVRLVAATHRDLAGCVAAGTFRQDLLFRLQTLPLTLPDLNSRPLDIPHLVRAFLEDATAPAQRWLQAPDMLALITADWSAGQIRHLEAVIRRALVEGEGDRLPHVPLTLDRETLPARRPVPLTPAEAAAAVAACGGNQSMAARLIGMDRFALRRLLAKAGVSPVAEEGE